MPASGLLSAAPFCGPSLGHRLLSYTRPNHSIRQLDSLINITKNSTYGSGLLTTQKRDFPADSTLLTVPGEDSTITPLIQTQLIAGCGYSIQGQGIHIQCCGLDEYWMTSIKVPLSDSPTEGLGLAETDF